MLNIESNKTQDNLKLLFVITIRAADGLNLDVGSTLCLCVTQLSKFVLMYVMALINTVVDPFEMK